MGERRQQQYNIKAGMLTKAEYYTSGRESKEEIPFTINITKRFRL